MVLSKDRRRQGVVCWVQVWKGRATVIEEMNELLDELDDIDANIAQQVFQPASTQRRAPSRPASGASHQSHWACRQLSTSMRMRSS